jgi:hypothetical protein
MDELQGLILLAVGQRILMDKPLPSGREKFANRVGEAACVV